MTTVPMTSDNFNELVKEGIVLIDFWAEWCGPCHRFSPVFESASDKHTDVVFAKVDTDVESAIAREFDVRSIPTIAAIRDGVVVFLQPGMLSPTGLENLIEQVRELDMSELKLQSEL